MPETLASLSTLGVIARPWKLPEAIWAVTGPVVLIVFGPVAVERRPESRRQGDRCISVSERHDAARGVGAKGRSI
jgi:hypothetical protein